MAQTTRRQKERSVRSVEVGDQTYRIGRISGYKFELALNIVTRVMAEQKRVQESLDGFIEEQRQKNTVRIYREQKDDPQYRQYDLRDEEFEPNGYTERRREVSGNAIFFHTFPLLWEVARDKLLAVLAVLATDDTELRQVYEAEGDEGVNDRLDEKARELMFEGDIDELMDLAATGFEALKERWDSKRDRLGNLLARLQQTQQAQQAQEPTSEEIGTPQPGTVIDPGPTQSSNGEQPNTSTSSQASTRGRRQKSYSGSNGGS